MLQWLLIIFIILDIAGCHRRVYIVRLDNNIEIPVSTTLEITPGANLTLRCALASNQIISDPDLTWGRRTKDIQFHNEYDLYKLLEDNNQHIQDLQYESDLTGIKHIWNFKSSDRGAYFCMSAKYKLFKIVHIKVRNINSSLCADDKFRCISNGFCISLHYQCDGKADCQDASDELLELCNGDPCEGKYQCNDGRCIPKAWCCDRRTDDYCRVPIRHPCCPVLPNPFDPLYYYNNQIYNTTKEISKGSGPRYLFIAVCVVSAILSFVLFLYVISKVCGFDKKPQRVRDNIANDNGGAVPNVCGHSECAIQRELTGSNSYCLYHPEVSDPLISINTCANNDRPPSYAEVVSLPPNIDKTTLEDLINAPPPPYSSTTKISSNQESVCCDTNL